MTTRPKHAIIIGGGVIGTACAHYLIQSGLNVTILERGAYGKGCSHANCGLICPSHVLPLAGPGAVWRTLQAMFQSSSPFYIKPRLDPSLWGWLIQFARRCNERDMLRAGKAIQTLLNSSRALYAELFETQTLEAEWEERGLLFVFRSAAAMDHYAETDRLMTSSFGVGAKRYDGNALTQLEPALKEGLAGGWHYELDAHVRPDRLVSSWRQLLAGRGATICEQCEFRGFNLKANHAVAVETTLGDFAADAFVLATGAWTPQLKLKLGCRIPIQPGKGYSITMPRPKRCPRIPIIFEEDRVVATPMQTGYRLGSIMEFAGYDASLREPRIELLRSRASHYLYEPTAEPILERWYGWRPMTYDSLPIIGRTPALANVYLAAGHNMLGLSMAPATGKLIAELVCEQTPHIDTAPYAATRF